jgi:hypothetical protein
MEMKGFLCSECGGDANIANQGDEALKSVTRSHIEMWGKKWVRYFRRPHTANGMGSNKSLHSLVEIL